MRKRAVVIGGGHNGLMAAITLREQGFDVTLLEARHRIGGMTDTEVINGVRVSRVSYVIGLMPEEFVRKFKIPIIRQDPYAVVYINGKVIPFWRDRNKRIKTLLDAGEKGYPEFEDKVVRFKEMMYRKFTFVDKPPSLSEVREEAVKLGVEELVEESASRFLSQYLSQDLQQFFIYPGMESSPAYVVAYFFSTDWSLVRGGMGSVAEAMLNHALSIGVNIKVGHRVLGLDIKGGLVRGVETNRGYFEADLVVSAISPLALNNLLHGSLSAFETTRPLWRKYNIVLRDYPKLPDPLKPYAHSIIDCEAGELLIPSILDDSRGGVVLELMGDLIGLTEMMPDIKDKLVYIDSVDSMVAEVTYNVPNGDVNHIPMRSPFILSERPGYTTPIPNLFQGSAGNYPGGQVTGIPGYNAAMLAARLMGVQSI